MISSPEPQFPEIPAHGRASGAVAREARLRKHADYQRVYHATRKQFSASMTWFLAPRLVLASQTASPRVGLTVGKVIGKAHERNRIKRRMRELVAKHLVELPDGIDLILHPRRSVLTMDFVKLDAEVLRIFRQVAAQTNASGRREPSQAGSGQPKPTPAPTPIR
jgi:ribonuclease P protein component